MTASGTALPEEDRHRPRVAPRMRVARVAGAITELSAGSVERSVDVVRQVLGGPAAVGDRPRRADRRSSDGRHVPERVVPGRRAGSRWEPMRSWRLVFGAAQPSGVRLACGRRGDRPARAAGKPNHSPITDHPAGSGAGRAAPTSRRPRSRRHHLVRRPPGTRRGLRRIVHPETVRHRPSDSRAPCCAERSIRRRRTTTASCCGRSSSAALVRGGATRRSGCVDAGSLPMEIGCSLRASCGRAARRRRLVGLRVHGR
jgi:hypothetical protein